MKRPSLIMAPINTPSPSTESNFLPSLSVTCVMRIRSGGAKELFGELSEWDREHLEIAATIDYVQRGNPDLNKDDLLECVRTIKGKFYPILPMTRMTDGTHGKTATSMIYPRVKVCRHFRSL